eukprot:6935598-Pyramimonas_sp.AAC.1
MIAYHRGHLTTVPRAEEHSSRPSEDAGIVQTCLCHRWGVHDWRQFRHVGTEAFVEQRLVPVLQCGEIQPLLEGVCLGP